MTSSQYLPHTQQTFWLQVIVVTQWVYGESTYGKSSYDSWGKALPMADVGLMALRVH